MQMTSTGAPAGTTAPRDADGTGGAAADPPEMEPGDGDVSGDPEDDEDDIDPPEQSVDDETDAPIGAGVDPVDSPEPFMCMPETAESECERCVQTDCCDERGECEADTQCAAEWEAVKGCVQDRDLANDPSASPAAVIEECIVEAAGELFAASTPLFNLLACVGAGFQDPDDGSEDPFGRLDGDGMCTEPCYGVFTLEPPDADPDSDL